MSTRKIVEEILYEISDMEDIDIDKLLEKIVERAKTLKKLGKKMLIVAKYVN